jgi:hypothetical protein
MWFGLTAAHRRGPPIRSILVARSAATSAGTTAHTNLPPSLSRRATWPINLSRLGSEAFYRWSAGILIAERENNLLAFKCSVPSAHPDCAKCHA